MSAINAIFSALGNNSSLWSIATKDGIETIGRTTMAYKEGSKTSKKFGKLEAREKLIEANATSLVWLGGIPLLKVLFDKLYTNKKSLAIRTYKKTGTLLKKAVCQGFPRLNFFQFSRRKNRKNKLFLLK